MNSSRYQEAERLFHRALAGAIALDDLQDLLTDLIWGVRPEDDRSFYRLVGPALLALAERDAHHCGDAEVLEAIDESLRSKVMFLDSIDGRRACGIGTGTSSRVIQAESRLEVESGVQLREVASWSEAETQLKFETSTNPVLAWG